MPHNELDRIELLISDVQVLMLIEDGSNVYQLQKDAVIAALKNRVAKNTSFQTDALVKYWKVLIDRVLGNMDDAGLFIDVPLVTLLAQVLDLLVNQAPKWIIHKAIKLLSRLGVQVHALILKLAIIVTESISFRTSILVGACIDYLQAHDPSTLVPFVNPILKNLVTAMIGSKTAVNPRHVSALATFYKHYLTKEVYQEKKLANFDKWLLRSPEVVISVIDLVTKHISFDVNQY